MKKVIGGIIIVVCLILFFNVSLFAEEIQPQYDVPLDWAIQDYLIEISNRNDISPELVLAVIEVESAYQSDVVDSEGKCFGLMQINKSVHKDLMKHIRCTDILDEKDNITMGIGILKELFRKYHDVEWVLMAYNGGEEYLHRQVRKGIHSTAYTKKVLGVQERLYNEQS